MGKLKNTEKMPVTLLNMGRDGTMLPLTAGACVSVGTDQQIPALYIAISLQFLIPLVSPRFVAVVEEGDSTAVLPNLRLGFLF